MFVKGENHLLFTMKKLRGFVEKWENLSVKHSAICDEMGAEIDVCWDSRKKVAEPPTYVSWESWGKNKVKLRVVQLQPDYGFTICQKLRRRHTFLLL